MREPNFSESQLQQAANTAFIRRIFDHYGEWAFAHVPSLIAEFDLGWDTAFHLDWLPHIPSPKDEGCNFFIQYKLSSELTSAGANEWSQWNEPYLRFKIPHNTDDYHQWDCLKALANADYPTFYATNSTLLKAELQNSMAAGTLLKHVPLLDVRTIVNQHKYVTFTETSNQFALHSEIEEAGKINFANVIEMLASSKPSSFSESSNQLIVALAELGKMQKDESWNQDLQRILKPTDRLFPIRDTAFQQRMLLTAFSRKHIGAELFWLPLKHLEDQ